MGAVPIKYSNAAPPAGGGQGMFSFPAVGDTIGGGGSYTGFAPKVCYGDWIFAIGQWRNAASYVTGLDLFGSLVGWNIEGMGPGAGGPAGCVVLSARAGTSFLGTAGIGTGAQGDLAGSVFVIVDTRPPIQAMTVDGLQYVHQYTLEGFAFVRLTSGLLALPPFGPTTPGPWVYSFIAGDGNMSNYGGIDTDWRLFNDNIFPGYASRESPSPEGAPYGGITLAPPTPTCALALAFSDHRFGTDGTGWPTYSITPATRVKPDYQPETYDFGGGVRLG